MERKIIKWADKKSTENILTGIIGDQNSMKSASGINKQDHSNEKKKFIMSHETNKKPFRDRAKLIGSKAMVGVGKGSAIGGTIGAIAGAIVSMGTNLVIPGLGFVIAGPVAAGFAVAGAGSLTGGIIGALAGAGISKDRSKKIKSTKRVKQYWE